MHQFTFKRKLMHPRVLIKLYYKFNPGFSFFLKNDPALRAGDLRGSLMKSLGNRAKNKGFNLLWENYCVLFYFSFIFESYK